LASASCLLRLSLLLGVSGCGKVEVDLLFIESIHVIRQVHFRLTLPERFMIECIRSEYAHEVSAKHYLGLALFFNRLLLLFGRGNGFGIVIVVVGLIERFIIVIVAVGGHNRCSTQIGRLLPCIKRVADMKSGHIRSKGLLNHDTSIKRGGTTRRVTALLPRRSMVGFLP